ncbi:tRNA pseudouridine(55) synthase TruB [Moorella sulfitireducens (nom. illeg.)]|uniref:tRNA pseudouridine(55) synthase TruB n=1 Tax=Neomoorella sulfitireducens TaxID=2972948 RepID=UPI0021AC8FD9|nr:tRNA pseudouridine(55) synthase TruB [Moorella sulfitireducens]
MTAGFINILKPPGLTSHDVVQELRRLLKERRIGHGGTLDPMAAGVLPVAAGRATRLLEYIQAGGKAYRAEFILGLKTDTQDLGGRVLARPGCRGFTLAELQEAARPFTGSISQVPPMVSAVHFEGRRLYELAREGLEVERPARLVNIEKFQVLQGWPDGPFFRVLADITCSKGTYIRTLGADWGDYLGCGATLAFLLRTRAGSFKLEEAWTLEEIAGQVAKGGREFLLPPAAGIAHLPAAVVTGKAVKAAASGAAVDPDGCTLVPALRPGHLVRLETPAGVLLAVARVVPKGEGYCFKPEKVLQ